MTVLEETKTKGYAPSVEYASSPSGLGRSIQLFHLSRTCTFLYAIRYRLYAIGYLHRGRLGGGSEATDGVRSCP